MNSKLLFFYQPANLNLLINAIVMKIAIRSDATQHAALMAKGIPETVSLTDDFSDADAIFDLVFDKDPSLIFAGWTKKPVLVNAVMFINSELPDNYIRINGWNGFLQNEVWEIVPKESEVFNQAITVLQHLGWKYLLVPDIPGMIAPRVIATIINEAYFALGENISSKESIDIAMRYGTNYPNGPFEWSQKIGVENVYALLKKLGEDDSRYEIAKALENEIELKTA